MIALDTETTGVDLHHGAKPFFVSTCTPDLKNTFWQWRVDPLTRQPLVPRNDIATIMGLLLNASRNRVRVVLHNAKFDVSALTALDKRFKVIWDWSTTLDTILYGHILESNKRKNLTDMCSRWLGVNILPFEEAIKEATEECRKIAREKFPTWLIAREGLDCMPSVKSNSKRNEDKPWKNDMWLPFEVAEALKLPSNHRYRKALTEYANADTAVTVRLLGVLEDDIAKRSLKKYLDVRHELLPIAYEMEQRGVTVSKINLNKQKYRYTLDSQASGKRCVKLAKDRGYNLVMPKGTSPNGSLRDYLLYVLKLPPLFSKKSKTDEPSLSKDVLDTWEGELQVTAPDGDAIEFIRELKAKRSRDTAVSYMKGYERYWIPTGVFDQFGQQLWYRLHPSLNPTGTDTLRWSSNNPNAQNISKKESFNLRYCFGPMPGREWWSMDGKNLELRIPAFEADERDLIWVFEHPNDAPYYGSYHLLVFDLLHPELFKQHGKKVKDLYESTWYQWVKNGNFAVIYGAQRRTADAAYRVSGAYDKISNRFPRIAALNSKMKAYANALGYVETIPDVTVDPERGYPLLVSRSEYGDVMPTTPLNYHISGTAMWWTGKAMIRCSNQLKEWNKDGWDGFMTLQVHDELVFDTPRGTGPEPWRTNLPRMRRLKQLMELGGADISVPTPVSIEYHADTWATGMAL